MTSPAPPSSSTRTAVSAVRCLRRDDAPDAVPEVDGVETREKVESLLLASAELGGDRNGSVER